MQIPFNLIVLKVFHAQKNKVRPLMNAVGLSPGQPKVLTFLALHGECLQKELAASCDIEPATISKLLNNLEENGLITRTGQEDDRRAIMIALTARGRTLFETEVEPRFARVNATSLAGFTEEEKRQFEHYLLRMYQNLTRTTLEF
mgnify:CR=1 FL=1